jgi:hypothetical protein
MARRTVVCVLSDTAVHAALCESRAKTTTVIERGRAAFPAPDSLLVDHDAKALGGVIREALGQIREPTGSVTLVVPMQWCFTHLLTVNDKRMDPESLGFELEPYLPLPLEEVVCAFEPLDNGRVFAAAIPVAPMAALVEGLEQRGVGVDRITVDTVAAARGVITPQGGSVVILDARWGRFLGRGRGKDSEASVGVFGRKGQVATSHASGLSSQLATDPNAENESDGWTSLELVPELNHAAGTEEASTKSRPERRRKVGEEAIDAIVVGACSGQGLNLRMGALAPGREVEEVSRLAVQVLSLALLLLVILIGGMQLHLRAIHRNLAQVDQQRLAVYQEVFHGDRLPPEAALRLASERVRLEGLTRRTTDTPTPLKPGLPSPLDVLRQFAAAIPSDVRIMLTDARVDESQLVLRGQTVEHRDAERIAEALAAAPGLEARPPRTTRLKSGGVEFSITAGPKNER